VSHVFLLSVRAGRFTLAPKEAVLLGSAPPSLFLFSILCVTYGRILVFFLAQSPIGALPSFLVLALPWNTPLRLRPGNGDGRV